MIIVPISIAIPIICCIFAPKYKLSKNMEKKYTIKEEDTNAVSEPAAVSSVVADNISVISSELQEKIDLARREYKNGECVSCSTKEELHSFLDSL